MTARRALPLVVFDGQLTFDGAPFGIRDAAYPAALRHLASQPYQEILAELRR